LQRLGRFTQVSTLKVFQVSMYVGITVQWRVIISGIITGVDWTMLYRCFM